MISNLLGKKSSSTGWLYQQLIKLYYGTISDVYITYDSDGVVLKPMIIDILKPYFDVKGDIYANNNHAYARSFLALTNIKMNTKTFMAEYMIFYKDLILEFLDHISSTTSTPAYEAIALAFVKYGSFSEFESYGSYVVEKYPKLYEEKYLPNFKAANRFFDSIPTADDSDLRAFGDYYFYIAFNHWDKNKSIFKPFFRLSNFIFGIRNTMRIYYYLGLKRLDDNK